MDDGDTSSDGVEEERIVDILNPSLYRLFWKLNSPLGTAIHEFQVARDRYYDPGDDLEPYARLANTSAHTDKAAQLILHPIAQESIQEPRVSSVIVSIYLIEQWEETFTDRHWECPDEFKVFEEGHSPLPEEFVDELPDPNRSHILRCCGQDRPPPGTDFRLEVKSKGDFLTIHEYVSAVHPWLISIRETLLAALAYNEGHAPWPTETRLAVTSPWPHDMRIQKETKWGRRRPDPSWAALSDEERTRRTMESIKALSDARIQEREQGRAQNQG